jgi:hypothetical protein
LNFGDEEFCIEIKKISDKINSVSKESWLYLKFEPKESIYTELQFENDLKKYFNGISNKVDFSIKIEEINYELEEIEKEENLLKPIINLNNFNPDPENFNQSRKENSFIQIKELDSNITNYYQNLIENINKFSFIGLNVSKEKIKFIKEKIKELKKKIQENSSIINFYYENSNPEYIEKKISDNLKDVEVCGKKLFNEIKEEIYEENIDKKQISIYDSSEFTKLNYWKQFSKFLNLINLSPNYWTIGLLIPNPSGIVKVPLPIIWKPLLCVKTNFGILVLWLTINGVIIYPVVWVWKFQPFGNGDTEFINLFRNLKVKIKENTGSENSKLKIIGNIDTDTNFGKNSPLTKDDIPILERLSLKNLLYLKYLNEWCSKAKPHMGFP